MMPRVEDIFLGRVCWHRSRGKLCWGGAGSDGYEWKVVVSVKECYVDELKGRKESGKTGERNGNGMDFIGRS